MPTLEVSANIPMLFTDADFISSVDNLYAIDGELSKNVGGNPALGVTMDGPGSVIRRTIEECGAILTSKFQSYSGYLIGAGTAAHQYAVMYTGGNNAINRPRFRLYQVVAIEPDPSKVHLRRWVEYRCLAGIFRAVFRRFSAKDYDRYAAKVLDYEQESKAAASLLWAAGVPVLNTAPLDCPGALRQLGAGTFDTLAVTHAGSGSGDLGLAWVVAITYTGQPYISPTNKGNAESARSAIVPVTTLPGERITVSIAGLTPPTGVMPGVGTSDGLYVAMGATGWNVYAGSDVASLYLQNAAPIPVTTLSYTLTAAPVLSGPLLQIGQFSTANYAFMNTVMRA